jgi:hypothetical protein
MELEASSDRHNTFVRRVPVAPRILPLLHFASVPGSWNR